MAKSRNENTSTVETEKIVLPTKRVLEVIPILTVECVARQKVSLVFRKPSGENIYLSMKPGEKISFAKSSIDADSLRSFISQNIIKTY